MHPTAGLGLIFHRCSFPSCAHGALTRWKHCQSSRSLGFKERTHTTRAAAMLMTDGHGISFPGCRRAGGSLATHDKGSCDLKLSIAAPDRANIQIQRVCLCPMLKWQDAIEDIMHWDALEGSQVAGFSSATCTVHPRRGTDC